MNPFYLDALQLYGYPALWLIVFVAAAGAPVSGTLLLFAAGAFAAFGDFNLLILFPVALSAAVLGDNLGYLVGRRVGTPILNWMVKKRRIRLLTPELLERGREYFRRRTALAIFLTRFLIVALGGPINLLAGVEQYPYRSFLVWDISGQTLGVIIPLGLGFLSAASWEEVGSLFGSISALALAALAGVILTVVFLRKLRQRKQAAASASSENAPMQNTGTTPPTGRIDAMSITRIYDLPHQHATTRPLPISD